jgi:uncharacterized membrane protein
MVETFNSQIKQVALAYKRLLKVKVTNSSLLKDIEENPFYPSLMCISDTFDRYNINNAAYNVSREQFEELEAPFIAMLYIPFVGSDFVLVTEITDNYVNYIYSKNGHEKIEKSKFVERFKNTVFIAQPDVNSGENNFSYKLKNERAIKNKRNLWISIFAAMIFSAIAVNITPFNAISFGSLSIIKLVGLSCASLLLAYDMDKSLTFVKNLCGAGVTTDCDAVLGSKAAKICGISWSEIGFFYFVFTTLVLFDPGLPITYKTGWLSLINVLAAPYILFSIYYQWNVIKQWCPLCLTVQAVLTTELIWSIVCFWIPTHSFLFLTSSGIKPLLQIVSLALAPIITWYGLKSNLLKAKDYSLYKNGYKRLQHNPDIFNSLLVQQTKAADSWQNLGIDLGNPDAPNTIISVCSISCSPCAEAHVKLEKIVKYNKNVNLKVIFNVSNDEGDYRAPVVRHLLAIAAQNNISRTQQALDDWYISPKQDYAIFATRYPMNGELTLQNSKIDTMSAWCKKGEITHTPTIYVNGYLLPENYDIEELMYIL